MFAMKMNKFILICLMACLSEGVIYPSIPSHLLPCYRAGGPTLGAPRRLDVFLSLLRKLEVNSLLNLRLFTAQLLRSFRLDGIEEAANSVETEFVTPYRASAFHFYKYKLLMDLFISDPHTEVYEVISLHEKCMMHKMISSTVRAWERGDESTVCPMSAENSLRITSSNNSRLISRCPIEDGVIQTEWGTISPGTLIAAVAAALEAQRVSVTDILKTDLFSENKAEPLMDTEWEIDIETVNTLRNTPSVYEAEISNVWAATLAGDLAEVAVQQGPRVGASSQHMLVGSTNRWNDTILPRDYYLLRNESFAYWQMTDAEILAGIDGLILAEYVPTWVSQRDSLRLHQILDMYYSKEGVSFDPSVKACNRQVLFEKIFDRSQLLSEMSTFAQILALTQGSVYIEATELDRISEAAVAAFVSYVPNLLKQFNEGCASTKNEVSVPVMDLIVATDGSWKSYDVQQFMSWVGGAIELGLEPSSLALVHGNTGLFVAPPADSFVELYNFITDYNEEWPNRLNFPNVVSRIIQYSQEKTLAEASAEASVAPSTVVLVVSPSDRLSATEVERARDLFGTLRTSYFDVYFAYVAQELTGFQNVNNEYMDYSELFVQTDSTTVADAVKSINLEVIKAAVPKRIIGPHCAFNDTTYTQLEFEDYVMPARENKYRIHPYYLQLQPLVNVVFRSVGQGSLLVCWWRGGEGARSCQTLVDRQSHVFNLTNPCPSVEFCPPAHFSVSLVSTNNICANNDCRVPHQVGYYIQHSGLRCLSLRNEAGLVSPSLNSMILITLFISLIMIYKK